LTGAEPNDGESDTAVIADLPTRITLRVGDVRRFRLPGLGTAGYSWVGDVSGDSDVVSQRVELAPSGELDGQPPGVSADEIAILEGRRPGHVRVDLLQRRGWEPPDKVLARHSIEVDVVAE
jgi:hypothetical protein